MVGLVLAYAILLYFSNMMARTASTALFFGEYDAATLPYTYLFLMVIGPLISFLYLRLNNRLPLSSVLLGVHGLLLLSLILLPLLLNRFSAPALTFALPIYFGVNNSLTISSFWNLLGRIYNLRQGKRLFSLLSSGEHMATIVAGFMAPFLVARIGTVNLYWIGAFFMAATLILLVVISRQNSEKLANVAATERERPRQSGFSDLIKEPYVRLIFALFTLFIVGIFMVGNIAYAQAELRYPTADEMAVYVGVFMGIFGLLSLIVQWVIAGRVLDRFGVRSMIMATPGGLFFFMLLFALVGTFTDWTSALFWIAAAASMYQAILDAVDSAAINIMYQPLPAQLRTQAQTTVIGVVYPLAMGVAGLLLVFLLDVLGFDSVQLAYAALAVILLWLFVGLRLGRAYPQRLRQALQERSFGALALARPDRAAAPVLVEALGSPHPAVVLYALAALDEIAPEMLPAQLNALLANPDSGVRTAVLERIAARDWTETPPAVLAILEGGEDPAGRAAALRTWAAVDPRAAAAQLSGYAADAQPAVREAALILMRLQDEEALRQAAAARISALAGSPDAAARLSAANVIAGTAVADQAPLLVALLGDEDAAVQRAALEAAAAARFPAAWPAVSAALARGESRAQAAAALAAGGEAVLPVLEAACAGPDVNPALLAAAASVCGRIGGPRALALLQRLSEDAHPHVRHEALVALAAAGYRAQGAGREAAAAQLLAAGQRSADLAAAQVDLGQAEGLRLINSALDQARRLEADNMLLLLSFLYDADTVLSAREALRGDDGSDERGAYAIESLDILLDHQDKLFYLPFLMEMTPGERLAKISKQYRRQELGREERLLSFLGDAPGTPVPAAGWPRLCALYALGELGEKSAAPAIMETAAANAGDALLLETAFTSLAQLDQPPAAAAAAYPSLAAAVEAWQARDPAAMMTLQKTDFLKQAGIFSHLPDEVLSRLSGLLVEVQFAPGERIMQKGEAGDYLYIVVDGHVRVHDQEKKIDTLARGEVVGEMALLDDVPRAASILAVSESRLLRLDRQPFFDLLATQPDLARDLLGLLSHRLRGRTADLPPALQERAALPVLPMAGVQPGMTSSVAAQGKLEDLDKLFVLKRVPLFAESADQLLGEIALLLEEVDLAGGETLFHEGDPGRSLYIVAAGQVRVHIEEATLAYLGEGEVFGEMALLEAEPRLATVTAVVPTQLLRLDQDPFFELLELQPALARGMIAMLSARLRARLEALAA